MMRIGHPNRIVAALIVTIGVIAHPLAARNSRGPGRMHELVGGRRFEIGGKLGPAKARTRPEVDLLTAAARREPDVVEIQSVGALRTRRRKANPQFRNRLREREAHRRPGPRVVGRRARIDERFPDRTVGAHRQRNVIRREDRTESEGEIRLPRRQRDVLDHEIVRRRVVEHLGVGFSRSPGVFARRTVIVIVDTDIVHGIGHRRGSRAGLGFPLLIRARPDAARSVAEIEAENRLGGGLRIAHDHAGCSLGAGAFSGRNGQRGALPRGRVGNGDRGAARTRGGRELQRGIGTCRFPRSVRRHGDDVRCGRGRIVEQFGGSDRERHPDGIGGAGHGDRLARGLARGGAHAHLNGSALGHVPHVEHSVTGTRGGFHPDGSRLGRPENLPPGVGDHTDRIVRRSRFVEGERCGFNGGIALVRRVVAAARGEQQQAQGERP